MITFISCPSPTELYIQHNPMYRDIFDLNSFIDASKAYDVYIMYSHISVSIDVYPPVNCHSPDGDMCKVILR